MDAISAGLLFPLVPQALELENFGIKVLLAILPQVHQLDNNMSQRVLELLTY